VMRRVFQVTRAPRSIVAMGLPEKHGYDLDFVLLAHELGASLLICEDRVEVLAALHETLAQLPDPGLAAQVETAHVHSLTDWSALGSRRWDWAVNTASVQRLPDPDIVTYLRAATQVARYAFLFVPNSGNRAHLTLSGLRGLELDQLLTLCALLSKGRVIASGYCDIPPFPPGLQRSEQAKKCAMHNPIETWAMKALEVWCRAETLMPRFAQRRLAHLVYIALDLQGASA